MSTGDLDIIADGMRYRCPATIAPTDAERRRLEGLPQAANEIPASLGCELQDGHPGSHLALGQNSGNDEWWLVWERGKRDTVRLPPCPAAGTGDLGVCLLPEGHHGRHSFDLLPAVNG